MNMRKIVIPLVMAFTLFAGGCGNHTSSTGANSVTATAVQSPTSATAGNTASPAAVSAVTCPTSNTTSFAKTKFVLHTGEAFGVFHRYLYKPYQAGSFTSSSTKTKVVAFAKAGAAALFIKREVRLASDDVKANPTLCKTIAGPLASLGDSITSAVNKLKTGDASGLLAANSAITAIEGGAGKAGDPVVEDPNAKIS